MSAQPQAQPDQRTQSRAVLLSYGASFSYQITLGLIQVLVPLYALHLGYDLTVLGAIVASQAIFGLVLRLFAGAIADQFGERWVLWASFVTMIAGMVFFVASGFFWMLILGQSFVGYSRATYWTATQSYVSRINPERSGEIYGRLNAFGSAGGLIGAFMSGVLVITLGYVRRSPSPARLRWPGSWAASRCRRSRRGRCGAASAPRSGISPASRGTGAWASPHSPHSSRPCP